MCTVDVRPEVEAALAALLWDMAVALYPEAPESVRIGPVDLGTPWPEAKP